MRQSFFSWNNATASVPARRVRHEPGPGHPHLLGPSDANGPEGQVHHVIGGGLPVPLVVGADRPDEDSLENVGRQTGDLLTLQVA